MNKYWKYQTRIGEARILPKQGRWHATINGEFLGSYNTPEQALDDLVGGHAFSHSSGADTATLGLPDELSGWELVRTATP